MGFWNDACQDAVSRNRADKIIAINTSSYAVVNFCCTAFSLRSSNCHFLPSIRPSCRLLCSVFAEWLRVQWRGASGFSRVPYLPACTRRCGKTMGYSQASRARAAFLVFSKH